MLLKDMTQKRHPIEELVARLLALHELTDVPVDLVVHGHLVLVPHGVLSLRQSLIQVLKTKRRRRRRRSTRLAEEVELENVGRLQLHVLDAKTARGDQSTQERTNVQNL
jgi:hypothetical protein